MARVTVEDCILKNPNRFDLVLTSAERAKNLGLGAPLTVDRDNDKNPVVALREIAASTISEEDLRKNIVQSLQRIPEPEEPGEEELEVLAAEEELGMAEEISEEAGEEITPQTEAAEGESGDEPEVPEAANEDEPPVSGTDSE